MNLFTPGLIIPLMGGASIRFLWNPYQIEGPTADANWVPVHAAGRELPYLHYTHGRISVIRFEIDLSRADRGVSFVKQMIDSLRSLTAPTVIGSGVNHPPPLKLILGDAIREICVLKRVRPKTFGPAHPTQLLPYHGRVGLTFWRMA